MKDIVNEFAREFCAQTHGSSDFDQDTVFVRGEKNNEFVPLSYLKKKSDKIKNAQTLQEEGYVITSADYLDLDEFKNWYQTQFNKKILIGDLKKSSIVHRPDSHKIFEAVEIVNEVYRILKDHKVLINGKNLPVQLGEWYSKMVFGFKQVKSSSQRGFDFYLGDGNKVEVIVHWQDHTSPKGVKLKKSLVEMSKHTVIMYVSKNFRIRDILLLDSDFVLRKFAAKGHTIFLKDTDVTSYFFSRSSKHYNRVVNMKALMQFSTPNLAIKIDELINKART